MSPNELLLKARTSFRSNVRPGVPMSRRELAELVDRWIVANTGHPSPVNGNYVGKPERGIIRWPMSIYRRAFREVLGADSDETLGFFEVGRIPRVYETGLLHGRVKPGPRAKQNGEQILSYPGVTDSSQ
jgi:hypothetical protein